MISKLAIALACSAAIPAMVLSQSWRPIGPKGGEVWVIRAYQSSLYLGTYDGQVYQIDSTGNSWLPRGQLDGWVHDFAFIGDWIYAATNDGLFRSRIAGGSWERLPRSIFPLRPEFNALTAKDGVLVAFVSQVGLVRSMDSGMSWTRTISPSHVQRFVVRESIVYAAGAGLLKSDDDGATWAAVPRNFTGTIYSLAVSDSSLFVGVNQGIYRSDNGGENWSRILDWPYQNIVYSLTLSGDVLFAGIQHDGIWRHSLIDGKSEKVGEIQYNVVDMAVLGNTFFAGTRGGGVFRSHDNGNTWMKWNENFFGQRIFSMAAGGDAIFVGTDLAGAFATSDQGVTWISTGEGLPSGVQTLNWHGNKLFAGVRNRPGVYLWNGADREWEKGDSSLLDTYQASIVCLASTGKALYAGTDRGLFRSRDSGKTWTMAPNGSASNRIQALQSGNGFLHVCTSSGYFRLDESKDSLYPAMNGADLRAMALGRSLFAVLEDGGVQKSGDQGLTWKEADILASPILALLANGDTVYAGSDGNGLFRSTDDGETWHPFNPGGLHPRISSLLLESGRLYVGTLGASIFVLETGSGILPRSRRPEDKLFPLRDLRGHLRFGRELTPDGRGFDAQGRR